MRASAAVATILLVLLTACSKGGDDCSKSELADATAEWDEAVEDARYCTVDADCVVLTSQSGDACAYPSCPTTVNGAEVDQLTSLSQDLTDRLEACGVTCLAAQCAAISEAKCIENKCTAVNATSAAFEL